MTSKVICIVLGGGQEAALSYLTATRSKTRSTNCRQVSFG